MKITFKKGLLAAIAALTVCSARADEGMWLLQLMKQQNSIDMMKKQGLKLEADDLYNPNGVSLKDAVGIFGGGCTGEIISPEGLILTNHHCGYGAIQQHSSVEHDYLTDGFWAMNRSEELPTPGLKFRFVHRIVDITDLVNAKIKAGEVTEIDALTSPFLNKLAKEELEKSDLKGKPGIEVRALPFYAGNKFYMFYYKVYSDVRMVAAPPSSVGKFGGETDNWMWPRHTGDFSLFRIYAGKDGQPSAYNPDNVPLQVKKHLTISLAGYREGDFTFVMGFPGRNWRYMISDEVEERMQTTNFMRHHVRDVRQKALMKQMLQDDAVRIHYASKYASSANYWKNAIGMNEGLVRLKVLDTKRAQQEALLARGRSLNDNSYQQAFDQIRAIVKQRRPALYHQQAIQEALVTGLDFMRIPSTAGLVSALKNKDKKQIAAAKDSLQKAADRYFASVPFPEVERIVGKEMLKIYMKYIPAEQRIGIFQIIDKRFKGNSDAFIDACFEHSIFGNKENFAKFICKPSLYKINTDWMVLLKYSITDGLLQTSIAMMDANKNYNAAHKVWVKGMMDMKLANGQPIYPDANSTLRLTYGQVLPYAPADGVKYDYYTTLKGAMEKEDPDNWEFVVPAKLKQLYQAKDFGRYAMPNGEMPICFIVNTDNTGGNSGSPVFNAKGELLGLAFDGNWEAMSSDILYEPKMQRTIGVDVRYILFMIEKYGKAGNLIQELKLANP